ncbi:MAG: hypothetical protein GY749_16440 [Desulfobacteraceae bacterium]|nr:hypothetical protein [Desulfobacteraceae bacterium]
MELIEHLPNPEVLMENIKCVNAKRYYVTIPNLGFIENRLRLSLGGKMPITRIIFHIKKHLRFWTVRDFKYWSEHLGYKVEHHFLNSSPPFRSAWIVKSKPLDLAIQRGTNLKSGAVVSYHGQNGTWLLWKIFPALFAKQMIYVLEKSG